MTKILVTGFEPFGGVARNPAQDIARALDGRRIGGAEILGRMLPVSMRRLRPALMRVLDASRPRAILALGLAGGEAVIRLERFGVNLADFPLADNDGQRVLDAALLEGGRPAVASTLPNRAIRSALLDAGIPARLSDSAGTYLCNACLYLLGIALEQRGWDIPFGFIHLPYLPEQAAALLAAKPSAKGQRPPEQIASMALETMTRAVEIAAEVSLSRMSPSRARPRGRSRARR